MNGYPVKKRGHAYKGTGKLLEFCQTPQGGLIAYYDAQTTAGNSGSPVRIDNKDMLQVALDYWTKRQDPSAKVVAE